MAISPALALFGLAATGGILYVVSKKAKTTPTTGGGIIVFPTTRTLITTVSFKGLIL